MPVWRLGHRLAPCDFPPKRFYAWTNRFDDPSHEYRTLYCADKKETCLREVLADLRPDIKAISEFRRLFGSGGEEDESFGKVTKGWRRQNVLAQARIEALSGTVVDVENPSVRKSLERRLAEFLKKEGVRHFNPKELRSKKRHVTKCISRALFDDGYAGIKFHSHLDSLPCYALFEFRARLNQLGETIPLHENVPELVAVCKEFSLTLQN